MTKTHCMVNVDALRSTTDGSDQCFSAQIRLPNGRALKRRFAAAATLSQVWSYVESEYSECLEMCLMQVSSCVMRVYK